MQCYQHLAEEPSNKPVSDRRDAITSKADLLKFHANEKPGAAWVVVNDSKTEDRQIPFLVNLPYF